MKKLQLAVLAIVCLLISCEQQPYYLAQLHSINDTHPENLSTKGINGEFIRIDATSDTQAFRMAALLYWDRKVSDVKFEKQHGVSAHDLLIRFNVRKVKGKDTLYLDLSEEQKESIAGPIAKYYRNTLMPALDTIQPIPVEQPANIY